MNMRCPKCGVEAAPGKRFCADCGAPLPIRCPKCGAEAQVGKPFCADCGTRLEAASPAAAGKPAPFPNGVRVAAEEWAMRFVREVSEYRSLNERMHYASWRRNSSPFVERGTEIIRQCASKRQANWTLAIITNSVRDI